MGKLLGPLARSVKNAAARAVVKLVHDAPKMQALQLGLLADEVADNIERFQEYGFTSHPHVGAEAVVIFPGGDRSHGLVVAVDDRRYRIKVAAGEVALYDDLGQFVHLKRDGIEVTSPTKILATAPTVTVVASTKVRMETPILEVTGEIKDRSDTDGRTMAQMRGVYNGHTHPPSGALPSEAM